MPNNTNFLTAKDLAQRWNLAPATIYDKANLGIIPGIKIGPTWRFDPQAIEAYETQNHNTYRNPLAPTDRSAKQRGWS
jgi:hypothetical protein